MIKGIIFDLDLCILDNRTMPKDVIKPVYDALFSSLLLTDEQKIEIKGALHGNALEAVLKEYRVPDEVAEPMRAAYRDIELPSDAVIKGFGDEQIIATLPTKNILVTSGYLKFQQSKIKLLGIESLFAYTIIDSIDSPGAWKGKDRIFGEILSKEVWMPEEVLVLGDNPKSELAAAKALGIRAVQVLRPGIEKWTHADCHIASLNELPALLK